MKADVIITLVFIPTSVLLTFSVMFVSFSLATKKGRRSTFRAIEALDFSDDRLAAIAALWSVMYRRVFGSHWFSWRRLLAVPVYTAVVSLLCFGVWLVYLYLFRNPKHLVLVVPPLQVQQGFLQYYLHGGYLASLLIDFISVQLGMFCIELGLRRGFFSARFWLAFIGTLSLVCLIFTLAVHLFHIWDEKNLYSALAPYDQMPDVAFEPWLSLRFGLHLFEPETRLYVTSQGMYSMYFLPEPVLLYAAIASQLSMVVISLSYAAAAGLARIKQLALGLVRIADTPKVSAYSVVALIYIGLFTVFVVVIIVCLIWTSWLGGDS